MSTVILLHLLFPILQTPSSFAPVCTLSPTLARSVVPGQRAAERAAHGDVHGDGLQPVHALREGSRQAVSLLVPQIQGNVFHDCKKFGFYMDNQWPRQVGRWPPWPRLPPTVTEWPRTSGGGPSPPARPSRGPVRTMGWSAGSRTRCSSHLTPPQFDWHNEFVGGYFAGDISWIRWLVGS